jgi:hypothetical protein
MNIEFFLERCEMLWPSAKPLTVDQRAFYAAKLMNFEGRDLAKIFDYLSETGKFFPKIADVFDAARHCSMLDRVQPTAPHEWTPTGCRSCGGSGQLAVFFEETADPTNGHRQRSLRRVMQYEASNAVLQVNDWTRFYFRCHCPAGDVPTLHKGLPRWQEYLP